MGGEMMDGLPLEGVRVLDLTRALAGPFCTLLLADLGAEVVKVEPLPEGDMTRQWGPFADGQSVYFLSVNYNKRSVALDLRSPEGLEVVRRLLGWADVLVENFRPGVAGALGLPWEEVSRRRPDLIYCSITGYGPSGPYRDRAGVDQMAQGMAGLMSVTGPPQGPPTRVGIPIADLLAGMLGALGVVSAHARRLRTGRGGRVETSLLEAMLGVMCFQSQRYLSLGQVPGPEGNDHPLICPYGTFQAGDGEINLSAPTDDAWHRLCRLLGMEEAASDPRFRDNTRRRENREALRALLNQRLRTRTRQEWVDLLNREGIPAAPIYRMDEVFRDPHVRACGILQEIPHPSLGRLPLVGPPLRLEGRHPPVRLPPPLLGEHTGEVLEMLGYSPQEVEHLFARGVAGRPRGKG